jgi:tRNA (guanine-N7-)-methyltransferase
MTKRLFGRMSVEAPPEDILKRYYLLYPGRMLYFEPESLPMISSETLFGNTKPLALDLGCGRAEFSIAQAQLRPEWNWVGIDVERKPLWYAVRCAAAADLDNILFVKADLRLVMRKVPDGVVPAAYVLFPSPAVKHKHENRDVLSEHFIADIRRVLMPGGHFAFVTDHREYYQKVLPLLDAQLRRVRQTEGIEGGPTWYQRLWERRGIPSLRAEYVKPAEA